MTTSVPQAQERSMIIAMNLMTIQTQGYVYDLAKGGSSKWANGLPKRGSPLNCQAAADLLIAACIQDGVQGLKRVYFKHEHGFIVLADDGMRAFGTNKAPHEDAKSGLSCWEFDNHYRVVDPTTKITYDPTFGTFAQRNPRGIRGNREAVVIGSNMASDYGNKYRVTRGLGVKTTIEDFNAKLAKIEDAHWVDNDDFK